MNILETCEDDMVDYHYGAEGFKLFTDDNQEVEDPLLGSGKIWNNTSPQGVLILKPDQPGDLMSLTVTLKAKGVTSVSFQVTTEDPLIVHDAHVSFLKKRHVLLKIITWIVFLFPIRSMKNLSFCLL